MNNFFFTGIFKSLRSTMPRPPRRTVWHQLVCSVLRVQVKMRWIMEASETKAQDASCMKTSPCSESIIIRLHGSRLCICLEVTMSRYSISHRSDGQAERVINIIKQSRHGSRVAMHRQSLCDFVRCVAPTQSLSLLLASFHLLKIPDVISITPSLRCKLWLYAAMQFNMAWP